MRKVEMAMCEAVRFCKNWRSGNTEVVTENGESRVYLHGNLIAKVARDYFMMFDGGWQSNTTKSRLNALCQEFAPAAVCGVFQKNWEWFVQDTNGVNDFFSGYTFQYS